ncbi:PadR family transcriptional regulator [Motilibacter aurantiacus]|uniref:PadR family transcriptional regulator n=1 Tax=Motilibacter aurantiacus TaxID=2714955 RepID=UPI00140725B0|nr:PadR family transcriptional regulator [Motilibacter aurantiacus]NHC47375.1 PadR family transcriptional regulator [Motilibacter aurantiacus]
MATRSSGVLELAVLGLLHEGPMHGYELRKRLNALLGTFRAFSYGSLYPALRKMLDSGLIAEDTPEGAGSDGSAPSPALAGKRARIVYRITAEGKEQFQQLLAEAGPDTWEDERFGVHLAFFRHTDAATRLRVLEGRRSRLEERRERVRGSLARTRERLDSYTLALQNHGLESVEREVRWLNELIDGEREGAPPTTLPPVDGAAVPDSLQKLDIHSHNDVTGSPSGAGTKN